MHELVLLKDPLAPELPRQEEPAPSLTHRALSQCSLSEALQM